MIRELIATLCHRCENRPVLRAVVVMLWILGVVFAISLMVFGVFPLEMEAQ